MPTPRALFKWIKPRAYLAYAKKVLLHKILTLAKEARISMRK